MRKSKRRSRSGHVGGLSEDVVAIIPPAAAAFEKASRPENDPILQATLSPEELSAIATQRQMAQNFRRRMHSQSEQGSKSRKIAERQRAEQRASESLVAPRRKKKREGDFVFSANRTEIVPPAAVEVKNAVEEERRPNLPSGQEDMLPSPPQKEKTEKGEKKKRGRPAKKAATKQRKGKKQEVSSLAPSVEEASVPQEQPQVQNEPAGGEHFFGNSIGVNLRPETFENTERGPSRSQVEASSPKPRRRRNANRPAPIVVDAGSQK